MPRTTEICTNGGAVKVGTTGTIGALMTRELEAMKNSPRPSTSDRRKLQTTPVSVLCGDTPRRLLRRRNQPNEPGSSTSNRNSGGGGGGGNAHNYQLNPPGAAQKPRYSSRKSSAQRVPMLGTEGSPIDRHLDTDKIGRRGHTYVVEVVDLKCGNPMSSRLRKLGFSKLSETIG